ncbi:MAG: RnfABCDGE type electron transport complex subunit G [Thermoanaerobaculales bacterium]|nr:RnfABCDGE type electron transport complex subunit G [Thermoanaerobaculales bacterium]
MKSTLNMALRLSLICAVAALALANVAEVTRRPIAESEARAQREAVEAVLPPFADLAVDTLETEAGSPVEYFSGVDDTGITGTAFTSVSGLGYSGEIEIILGVNPAGEISGVRILRHAETPGLGANYADPELLNRFYTGRRFNDNWKVAKDGGEVDALTGATITGRAIADAVERGVARYRVDKDRIKAELAPVEAEGTSP